MATFSTAVIGLSVSTYGNRNTLGGRATAIFRVPLIYFLFSTLNFLIPLLLRGTKKDLGIFNVTSLIMPHFFGGRDESDMLSPTKFIFYDPKQVRQESCEFQKKPQQGP